MPSNETDIFRPVLIGSGAYTLVCMLGMYGAYRAGYADTFAFDLSPFMVVLGAGVFGASCLVLLASSLLAPDEHERFGLRVTLLVAGLTVAIGLPLTAIGGYMFALDYPTWAPFFRRGAYAVIAAGIITIVAMTLRVTIYWDEEEPCEKKPGVP
jgi:hypothetical protein